MGRDAQQTRQRFDLGSGTVLIMLGFLAYLGSRVVESGFVHGLFQGAAIALIIAGVYVLAMQHRRGRTEGADGGMWLPSRDDERSR